MSICAGALMLILVYITSAYSCGPGYTPYIPTSDNRTSSCDFFLIEKGVTGDLFDVKKLQPLFRNIMLSGNERNSVKPKQRSLKKAETDRNENDSTAVISTD